MSLPPEDVENADYLTERLAMENNAATVSTALQLMNEFVDVIDNDGQLLIKNKDGSVDRLILRGVDKKRRRRAADSPWPGTVRSRRKS